MPQEFEPGCQRPVVKRKNVEVGALESARKENPQAKPDLVGNVWKVWNVSEAFED